MYLKFALWSSVTTISQIRCKCNDSYLILKISVIFSLALLKSFIHQNLIFFMETEVKVECPPVNDPNAWAMKLPNPEDCGSYYICDWGTPVYMPCPEGLHFNAELQVCDWPGNAGCEK